MTASVFTKEAWLKALEGAANSFKIWVPVKDGDFHTFMPMGEKRPDFDYQNSRLSPKAVVFPQSERMFEYSLGQEEDAHILKEAPKDYGPRAVVGIRPCDAHGFHLVKRNFDSPEFRDPWWVQGFEATTLVGLGCNEPCATCFCTQVGGGPFEESCLDALLYDLGDQYLVKALTSKGETFLAKLEGGGPAKEAHEKQAQDLAGSAASKITSVVPTDQLGRKVQLELFNAPFWDDVAFACLNCGTCTFLCPTCWCFDIQDEVYGTQGDRMRNWDSCMFPLFTLHGSGHNPRNVKTQRVRQRFMHKLKYYVDKYQDGIQCSGCGRCVRYCPVNIDIRKVCSLMNAL